MTPTLSLRARLSLLLRCRAPVARPLDEAVLRRSSARMQLAQETSRLIGRGLQAMHTAANGREDEPEPPEAA